MRGAVFDEPNLVSAAGLVPVVALAGRVGLREPADQFLTVPTDKGANAGLKVTSLVAGVHRDREDRQDAAAAEAKLAANPLGRAGQPADVAGAVAFLCSSDAEFSTGSVLDVYGGLAF